jgi:hypothetical protein
MSYPCAVNLKGSANRASIALLRIIAHRIATVRWADLIYVIENSRGVEFGDWNVLSARPCGRFRAMREAQESPVLTGRRENRTAIIRAGWCGLRVTRQIMFAMG